MQTILWLIIIAAIAILWYGPSDAAQEERELLFPDDVQ
jgi:hypothetical protein